MPKPNNARTLQIGLAVAAGLLVANAIVMPLISERSVFDGIMIGFIAASLVLAVYSVIAIRQSRDGSSR